MSRYWVGTLLAIALLVAAPVVGRGGSDEPASRVFTPSHRSAASLQRVAEAVLGEEGTIALDGDALVLVGPAAAVERALSALEARDRPQPTVLLQAEVDRQGRLRSAGYRIRSADGEGPIAIGSIVEREGPTRTRSAARTYSSAPRSGRAIALRVRSGETARFQLEDLVTNTAYVRWWVETTSVSARSGLEVTPLVWGEDRVTVALRWSEADLEAVGRSQHRGIETQLEIRSGDRVVVAALAERGDRIRPTRTGASPQADALLLLRVEVLPPES